MKGPKTLWVIGGGGYIDKGGAITTDQDVGEVFDQKIREGLTRKGFSPRSLTEGALRSLKVEIRSLEYYTSTGFWTGGVHAKAAIKVVAGNGRKDYEHFYRGGNENRVLLVPFAEENETIINAAVSDILQKLFSDATLFQFLSN